MSAFNQLRSRAPRSRNDSCSPGGTEFVAFIAFVAALGEVSLGEVQSVCLDRIGVTVNQSSFDLSGLLPQSA